MFTRLIQAACMFSVFLVASLIVLACAFMVLIAEINKGL